MKRDFTYIDDIVSGIYSASLSNKGYRIYNLGNSKPETLSDFISILENNLGIKAKIKLKPLQKGDMVETFANISRAQTELDYNPQTTLKAGLKKFVNWYIDYENKTK